ncbi:response regulator [Granulicella cerasi]|uniref:histidine kinase n=1 Tax=Granulicella cerasi TaxID=741063 RepID=A0ABW1Z694_9BACT|nr:hybrid sensor histidine kinase/response regulator [Granulicella cerasi]
MNTLVIAVVVFLTVFCGVLAMLLMRASHSERELRQRLFELQRQLTNAEQGLMERRQLDGIKDEFISTVSHELRTPLTSIRGALGLLSSGLLGQLDVKAANLLRIAVTNTDRLVRLINDILDLERMDSGRAAMQLRPCSLHEIIQQSVETMQSMAHDAGVRIEVVPEPGGMPAAFEGDPDRIQQVLVNLLSNAVKFSTTNSTVLVRSQFDASTLSFRVQDSGRGIPADKLESIFGRFTQVENADSRQKGGTGLGLAICRTILAQHGGIIHAERNDGDGSGRSGSTFVVKLPRSASAEAEAKAAQERNANTVLVCDDDEDFRHLVAEMLRIHGYSAIEAGNGEDALKLVTSRNIEVVLLDLCMPGLSGWQTLELLKSNARTARLPVVVLSVLGPAEGSARHPIEVPPEGWVQKPFGPESLLGELSRVLYASGSDGRILLVEDDADLAAIVMASFAEDRTASDVRMQHARSLAEAQNFCRATPPEAIILDLKLPDGTGFMLAEWLRQQPSLRSLPLIVYSGAMLSQEEREQLRLGPTQFLDKARVSPQELERLVVSMIQPAAV